MDAAAAAVARAASEKRAMAAERERLETLRKAFETASVELSAER